MNERELPIPPEALPVEEYESFERMDFANLSPGDQLRLKIKSKERKNLPIRRRVSELLAQADPVTLASLEPFLSANERIPLSVLEGILGKDHRVIKEYVLVKDREKPISLRDIGKDIEKLYPLFEDIESTYELGVIAVVPKPLKPRRGSKVADFPGLHVEGRIVSAQSIPQTDTPIVHFGTVITGYDPAAPGTTSQEHDLQWLANNTKVRFNYLADLDKKVPYGSFLAGSVSGIERKLKPKKATS